MTTDDIRSARLGDVDIAWQEHGDPAGPLALCLHGYPDSPYTWRHLVPELVDDGHRVVTPFLRGYAPSGLHPGGRYDSGTIGVDANALHDHLGAGGDAVLIGHDWGALGAYAASGLEPSRWRKVVAAAVPPGPAAAMGMLSYDQQKRSWYMFFQMTPLAEMAIQMDDHAFIRRLWADWSPGYDATDDVARFVECVSAPGHLAAALAYYAQTLDAEQADPALAGARAAALSLPPQPLLYLHGRDDGCMGAEIAELVPGTLAVAGSHAEVIDGVGHFLHLEDPAGFNERVLAFLREGAPARR